MTVSRRGFLLGLGAAIAAPAVVRSGVLELVRGRVLLTEDVTYYVDPYFGKDEYDGLSPDKPIRSIQKALDKISIPKERAVTFNLASGTYSEIIDSRPLGGDMTLHADGFSYIDLSRATLHTRNQREPLIKATNHSVLDLRGTAVDLRESCFGQTSLTPMMRLSGDVSFYS